MITWLHIVETEHLYKPHTLLDHPKVSTDYSLTHYDRRGSMFWAWFSFWDVAVDICVQWLQRPQCFGWIISMRPEGLQVEDGSTFRLFLVIRHKNESQCFLTTFFEDHGLLQPPPPGELDVLKVWEEAPLTTTICSLRSWSKPLHNVEPEDKLQAREIQLISSIGVTMCVKVNDDPSVQVNLPSDNDLGLLLHSHELCMGGRSGAWIPRCSMWRHTEVRADAGLWHHYRTAEDEQRNTVVKMLLGCQNKAVSLFSVI